MDNEAWLWEHRIDLGDALGVALERDAVGVAPVETYEPDPERVGILDLLRPESINPVPPYSPDALAQVSGSGTHILIEHHPEGASLQRLGQLLACMADMAKKLDWWAGRRGAEDGDRSKKSVVRPTNPVVWAVWTASSFDNTQLKAIRWLNDQSSPRFAFSAVEVEVAAADPDDGARRPSFRVVAGAHA